VKRDYAPVCPADVRWHLLVDNRKEFAACRGQRDLPPMEVRPYRKLGAFELVCPVIIRRHFPGGNRVTAGVD
jgi:hypothetical protein